MELLIFLPGSQQHPDSIPEMGEDAVTSVSPSFAPPTLTEEERQELQEELVKVRRGNNANIIVCRVCCGALNTRPSVAIQIN